MNDVFVCLVNGSADMSVRDNNDAKILLILIRYGQEIYFLMSWSIQNILFFLFKGRLAFDRHHA